MEKYEPPKERGFTSIPVLQFLNGLPWNTTTKNMLFALRPNYIREVYEGDGVKMDACCWRVTVWLKCTKDNLKPVIKRIEQEVSIGLGGGYDDADDLERKLLTMGMRRLRED